jgi:mRNA interferase RelE/StbE
LTTSEGKRSHKYKLRFMPEALEEWHRLDGSVKASLKKLLAKRLDHPHVSGGQLHGPLLGCYKIKLRQQGVRLVYSVEDDHLLVTVLTVDKREDGAVYRSAQVRLTDVAISRAQGKPRKGS